MARNWRIAIVVGVLVLIGLGNLVFSGGLPWLNAKEDADTDFCRSPEDASPPQLEQFGPADAPITIKAFYDRPTADSAKTLELLKRFVTLYEPSLRVEFIDSSTHVGNMRLAAAGLETNGLTVNGRGRFARIVSGELQTIRFLEAPHPYGCRWREMDLHAFVKKELEHLNLDTDVSDEDIAETGEGQTFTVGNPDSLVKVIAYYPMPEDCVDETCIILREVADAYKDRVYFEFVDTCSDDGYVQWREARTVCHGIVINGKQEYPATVDGQPEDITFYAPLDTQWTRAQLEKVIEGELRLLGGGSKPDVE